MPEVLFPFLFFFVQFLKSELQDPFEKWNSINIIIKEPAKQEVGPGEGHGDNSVGVWELGGRTWVPKQGFNVCLPRGRAMEP